VNVIFASMSTISPTSDLSIECSSTDSLDQHTNLQPTLFFQSTFLGLAGASLPVSDNFSWGWREKQHIGNLQLSSHWWWCLYFAVKRDWENNWKMLKRCLRDAGTAAAEGLEQCQTTPSVHCNVVADLLINAKALVACQNIKKCCGISQKRRLLTPGSSWPLRLRQKLQILLDYQRVKFTLKKSHQNL
jgi:hypothetical protein